MSAEAQALFANLLGIATAASAKQLQDYRPNLAKATGLLPYQQLAPLPLDYAALFSGLLGLDHGGTGADLSGTGPGVPFQATPGAVFTVGDMPFGFLDFTAAGSFAGALLIYDGAGGAAFDALNLSNDDSTTGILKPGKGGTGVNNSTRNLTIATNGGTLAFSAASKTLTIPDTGTAALLGLAQTFSENNSFAKLLRAHVTSGSTGYGIRVWDGTNDFGNFQGMDLGSVSYLFFGTNRYYDGGAWQQFNTRVGSSFQIAGDKFDFYNFPTSSSVPTSRFGVTAAGDLTHTGYIQGVEITAPAAGAANSYRLFAVDNGAGKTKLMAQFATGAAQQLAIQP